MKKERTGVTFLLTVFILFLIVPVASAHVTVQPAESTTNAYEKYSVRVPVEKEINTTEVSLQIPEGVDLVSVMPMTTWDYKLEKDENERVTAVIWTANEGGIKPGEFIEFDFVGVNASEPGEVSWKAFQTYEDGSVVEWVGPPDSEEPASVTTIADGDAVTSQGEDGVDAASPGDESAQGVAGGSPKLTHWVPITLSGLALLLALIGLFRKRA